MARKANLSFAFASLLAIGCVGVEPTSQTPSGPPAAGASETAASFVGLDVSSPGKLVRGTTATIAAIAIDTLGNKIDVTNHVTWTTTDLDWASAEGSTLRGLDVGKVRVIASLGEMTGSAEVEIVAASLESLTLRAASETARAGVLTSWQVIGHYDDGTDEDVTMSAAWSTSDPSTALVQDPGRIYAIGNGMAVVTASLSGLVASAPLMIADPTLIDLRIGAPASAMAPTSSEQLTATGVYSDGSTADLTAAVGWSTSNEALATVSAGQVQALASGVVTITATSGDLHGSIDLTLAE